MKKLITLLTLLLCAITSAWAQGSFNFLNGSNELNFTPATDITSVTGLTITTSASVGTGDGAWKAQSSSRSFTYKGSSVSGKTAYLKTAPTVEDNVPTAGSYIRIVASKTGSVDILIYVNAGSNKEIYIYDGTTRTTQEGTSKTGVVVSFPVESGKTYYVYGNTNGLEYHSLYFTCGPVFSMTTPATTTDVTVNTNIVLTSTSTFSKVGSSVAGTLNGSAIEFTVSSSTTLTYTPASDLANNTTYTVVLNANQVKDGSEVANQEQSFTFKTINPSPAVLTISSDNTSVGLTSTNIANQNYLSVTTDNWSSSQTIGDYTGTFYNMSSASRKLTIKVTGAKCFEVYVKGASKEDGTGLRPYKIKVGDNAEATIIHPAKIYGSTDVWSSGKIACPDEETTIVLGGGGDSVYPAYFVFYTTDMSVDISAAGYASFSNAGAVTIPSGVKAYYMSEAAGTTAKLTEITGGVIPANTGVVLEGSAGTYSFAGTTTATTYADNKLVANLSVVGTKDYEAGGYYTLAAGPSFKLSTGYTVGTASTFLAAGKAFLPKASVEAGARELTLNFDDETAINALENATKIDNGAIYDLSGRRVENPTKGIYIKNGKKVIFK